MRNYPYPRDPGRGIQLRTAREAAGIGRARLGLALAAHIGRAWSSRKAATKISAWENGRGFFSPNRLDLLCHLIDILAAEDARNGGQNPHGPRAGATAGNVARTSRPVARPAAAYDGTVA